MARAWLKMKRVSREGVNTRSAKGSTTVPGRFTRAWMRSKAWVHRSRISVRRSKLVVCRCGFKTFNLALPRDKGAESDVLPVGSQSPDSPCSMRQITAARVE